MLTYDELFEAVDGAAVAVRGLTRLQPAGGAGTKVFPPTYLKEGDRETKYAFEDRVIDGSRVRCVLLDSVASAANRTEEQLERAWDHGELSFPVAYVDFGATEVSDLDRITVLEASHRLADAIFRDSLLDGTLFRLSDVGIAITEARPQDAGAMLRYCPTALIFGQWDSTGPKGGLGSKFQRAFVSEIVGINAQQGVKVGSRIDALAVEKAALKASLFEHEDPEQVWTDDPAQAAKDGKGKPIAIARPSEINHGNIAPTIDDVSGGVTIDHAELSSVLSLAALRKLRFPTGNNGTAIPREKRRHAEATARAALAALGMAAMVLQQRADHDLRSRCLLIPESLTPLELVGRDGSITREIEPDEAAAAGLLKEAAGHLASVGLDWFEGDLRLTPAPKLVALVADSRAKAAMQDATDEA